MAMGIQRQAEYYLASGEESGNCKACGEGGPLTRHAAVGGLLCHACTEIANEVVETSTSRPGIGLFSQ